MQRVFLQIQRKFHRFSFHSPPPQLTSHFHSLKLVQPLAWAQMSQYTQLEQANQAVRIFILTWCKGLGLHRTCLAFVLMPCNESRCLCFILPRDSLLPSLCLSWALLRLDAWLEASKLGLFLIQGNSTQWIEHRPWIFLSFLLMLLHYISSLLTVPNRLLFS